MRSVLVFLLIASSLPTAFIFLLTAAYCGSETAWRLIDDFLSSVEQALDGAG